MQEIKKSKALKRYERRGKLVLLSLILFITMFIPPMIFYICWTYKNILLIVLSAIYGIIHYSLMIYGADYRAISYDEYLKIESQKQTKRNIKKNRKWLQ